MNPALLPPPPPPSAPPPPAPAPPLPPPPPPPKKSSKGKPEASKENVGGDGSTAMSAAGQTDLGDQSAYNNAPDKSHRKRDARDESGRKFFPFIH